MALRAQPLQPRFHRRWFPKGDVLATARLLIDDAVVGPLHLPVSMSQLRGGRGAYIDRSTMTFQRDLSFTEPIHRVPGNGKGMIVGIAVRK